MNKLKSNLLLLTVVIATNIIPTAIYARENTSTTAKPQKQSTSILKSILSLFKSPENRLITRGDEVCPISPGNLGEQLIWSDRPLFIWQGDIPQSEITLYSPTTNYNYERDEQIVWNQTIAPNTTTIAYAGEQLQPGFSYDWQFVSGDKTYRPTFVLMEQAEREAIAAELTALETQLQNNSATAEAIAIAKADYFIERQLWSDALQQIYSVANPSAELTDYIKDIEQYLCDSGDRN